MRSRSTSLRAVPLSLDFGLVDVGNTHTLTVEISNPGTAPVEVSGVLVTEDPAQTFSTAAWERQLVEGGAAVSVAVHFTPRNEGLHTAQLFIQSDATSSPELVVGLIGTARSTAIADAGPGDSGFLDAGEPDAGVLDAGDFDAGVPDSGEVDAGELDAGTFDAGVLDAGVLDGGLPVQLSGGERHTCALTVSGGVKCWGDNGLGQLGDGQAVASRLTPGDVPGLTAGVRKISAGMHHTCVLTNGGGAKCWGQNQYGQLGDGTKTLRSTPIDVLGLTAGVIDISADRYNSCAIVQDGGTKCWGDNSYYQLGRDPFLFPESLTAVDIAGINPGAVEVSTAATHSCVRTTSGTLQCWGENLVGSVGDGTTNPRLAPFEVFDGGVLQVAAGSAGHTCALMSTGAVKCWGYNFNGQVDDGGVDVLAPTGVLGLDAGVAAVVAGMVHNCALTNAGAVLCWGNNSFGELGDNAFDSRGYPALVAGLDAGVTLIGVGKFGRSYAVTPLKVLGWGFNVQGQLGDGTTTQRRVPVEIQGPW